MTSQAYTVCAIMQVNTITKVNCRLLLPEANIHKVVHVAKLSKMATVLCTTLSASPLGVFTPGQTNTTAVTFCCTLTKKNVIHK